MKLWEKRKKMKHVKLDLEAQIKDTVKLGECHFTVVDAKFSDASQILAYYERMRGYIQHEDGLINSRLTWSLTVHGFLFAIFGLLAGKITDIFITAQKDSHLPPQPRVCCNSVRGSSALRSCSAVTGRLKR
jgi:hypothetical protein